jgi:predicted ATPase
MALSEAFIIHQSRREVQAAQERAEAVIRLSSEYGFPLTLAQGTIYRGWALAMLGQGEEGIAQMRQGLAALRATGAEVGRPYYLLLLAMGYINTGQAEEGLSVVAEAVDAVHKTGERGSEAGLYVLKGWLLLMRSVGNLAETEACFLQAADIARRLRAKSLELLAAMSLARLWQQQGKKDEARQVLAEVYNWFTEGFDTAGLQEAKALLEALK